MATQVIAGFSLTNRWLLYTSLMLTPAQFLSGIDNNCPSNIGFLAYNWYTQVYWYLAIKNQDLHALSLLPVHFNTIFAFTYLGGITSGNLFLALIAGFGTAGLIVLNTVAAWTSWAMDQPDGFGQYQFFFFGWRTLDDGWHKFLLLWQIGDSVLALIWVFTAIIGSVMMCQEDVKEAFKDRLGWLWRYPAIIVGAAIMMFISWPLVMWTELIVSRNNIESDTDWVAVWLFVVQAGTMLVPGFSLKRLRGE